MAMLPQAKPPMATSTLPPTAMYTRIPGAAGIKPKARNPPQATREPTPRLPADGEGSKRAVGRRPLEAEAAVGNPERQAPVDRQAAVAAAGAVAGEANGGRDGRQ